ncbi:MAG: DNA-protecting protein DprA [Bacteroides sp.]|nr:DNA-protecting protein DprA [Bacteroides sp.]
MIEYYLWLLQLMGAANPKSCEMIRRYGSPEAVYNAVYSGDARRFLSPAELRRLRGASLENSEKILDICGEQGVKIVTVHDSEYPQSLANIYNPPLLLFYKGDISCLNSDICISAVGTRDMTEYTMKVTRRTTADLSKLGAVMISGMANGVDHTVHKAAVDAGGKTVGVLACGMAVDYPRGSMAFREEMYRLGGACISELLPTERPSRSYFSARNRIISGLGLGVIVFQAGMKSGALITADHAVNQGKDLFCIPPADLFSANYCGVVGLLRDGAVPLFNYLDVVNYYFSDFTDKLDELNQKFKISYEKPFVFRENTASEKDGAENTAKKSAAGFNFENREPEIKRIYDYLCENGEQRLEDITEQCGISPEDISLYLIDMELEGLIEAKAGSNYCIKV